MSLTRRRLFERLGSVAVFPMSGEVVAARGREAAEAEGVAYTTTAQNTATIRIASNENPLGPGQHVLDAIVGKFPEAGRYPFNAKQPEAAIVSALASMHKVANDRITLSAGSGELLVNAVRAFCSADKPLVTAWPSFEAPVTTANKMGIPVKMVELDGELRIDIPKLVEASKGAGLVFFCNPNNPTGTVHGAPAVADFVKQVRAASPNTFILIDEAYHEYATDPSYQSALSLAVETPNVFVTRTFSKAYGMAGLRVGYAVGHTDTIAELNRYRMPFSIGLPNIGAAVTALGNQRHIETERARNTSVRDFTTKAFQEMGYTATDSQTNFVFVNLKAPAAPFREACREHGVLVGRDFPPYEKTHVRISMGTMDEMQRAVQVFRKVLGNTTIAAGQHGR
jgi:histidinol-phosphate aminotransferase